MICSLIILSCESHIGTDTASFGISRIIQVTGALLLMKQGIFVREAHDDAEPLTCATTICTSQASFCK